MGHLPDLIYDLALILITGAITTILFRKIKQPLVLGYIIAGFIVGPYTTITPTVTDPENVEIWAEIGVIFLLFSLGLEFSFRKLRRLGGTASLTAGVEIIFILLTGYLLGQAMGWPLMDSVFLGGMLASSSTTIISKAFDELSLKTQRFAGIVVGVLIVEDLVVIMIMVLLSTIAVTQLVEGMQLLTKILKLSAFLVLWFAAGLFMIPYLMRKAKKLLNDETLLILSIGLCLVMVVVATRIGFSAELGAFIMGSILAETTSSEKIEHLVRPVKNLFGAIFFVSVGMLIDPALLVEYRWPILWVTLLVIGGKLFSTTAGAILSGRPLKQSVQIGMSMAQVGEFAFIVASLGLSLGVISEFLFPVAVGVSAITTFTTPYMIKASPWLYEFLERKLPESWLNKLNAYSAGAQTIQSETSWKTVVKKYISIILINFVIVFALFLIAYEALLPFARERIENNLIASLAVLMAALLVASPFLWAIMAKHPENLRQNENVLDRKYNRGPLFVLGMLRVVIGILLVGFLLDRLFSASIAFLTGMPVIILAIILFSRGNRIFHRKIVSVVTDNLADDEPKKPGKVSHDHISDQIRLNPGLGPWDVHLTELEVNQNAPFIGKSLKELAWRETFGINIIYIKRGERLIFAPDRQICMNAFDHVGIIGTDEQLQTFTPVFEATSIPGPGEQGIEDITIQSFLLEANNKLEGMELGKSGIRELTDGLVIGLERDGKRILNPDSSTVFRAGDLLWIAGVKEKINFMITESILNNEKQETT